MLVTPLKWVTRFSVYRYRHIATVNVVPFHMFHSLYHNSKTVTPTSSKIITSLSTINTNQKLFIPLKSIKPFSIYRYKHIVPTNVVPFHTFYILHDNPETATSASTKFTTNLNIINTNRMLFTPSKSDKPFSIYRYKHLASANVVLFHTLYIFLDNSKTTTSTLTKITKNLNTINTNQMQFTPLKSNTPLSIYRHENI